MEGVEEGVREEVKKEEEAMLMSAKKTHREIKSKVK